MVKSQEVNIDFVTDLPVCAHGADPIMVVIYKATHMAHLICCNKIVTAAQTAKLYIIYVAKLH